MTVDPTPTDRPTIPDAESAEMRPRRVVSVRVARLADEGTADDLTTSTTVAERLEMVHLLSRRMWELTGRPWPSYARHDIPVRVIRRRPATP